MTSGARLPVAALAVAVAVAVVWWVARQPDPGAVDRVREAPEAVGAGPLDSVNGPITTVTSSMGDATGNPSGRVAAGSVLIDIDDDTLTATSLVDGESVWTYGREDEAIDDWTLSGDAVWVLFEDHLLVRVDVQAGKVAGSTVFDKLYDGDTAPALTSDGLGGVVLQGPLSAAKPVWWVGSDLEPVAMNLPPECDAHGDATSDGDRIYLIALCADDEQRVMAFGTDGSSEWANESTTTTSLEVDRGHVVAHGLAGSELLDAETGQVAAHVPAGSQRLSYLDAADGLVVAWESDASPTTSSLAVWSVDERRFVWRLPGMGDLGRVSAPLVSDGHLYYTETTYGDDPAFRLVVVDVESGGETSTDLRSPGPASCDGGPTAFRPEIYAGIPGGIVVSWEDDNFCADPVLEVYAASN